MPISRRSLLKGAAAAGGLAALGGANLARALDLDPVPTPGPLGFDLGDNRTFPVDTVVVLMMENRSFDHFLGWLPGANTSRERSYPDPDNGGVEVSTYRLAPDFQGCGHPDPNHGWDAGRHYVTDGFLYGGNDELALGYYDAEDVPVWASLTANGTTFDQYHCALMGPTWPNRWYQHAATSGGRTSNSPPTNPTGYTETTIWDRCDAAGVSWAYYYSNLPFIGLYGARLAVRPEVRHISAYYADCAAGTLPQVVFVDPFFTTPAEGMGNDDHPLADIRLGQQLISQMTRAFASSSAWSHGALFVNYDEYGGFFDSVTPPRTDADDRANALDQTKDFGLRGFRTPAAVISPYATPGAIGTGLFDHTSILRFIEWRFGMQPLTLRDAAANNIGSVLNRDIQTPTEVDILDYTADPAAYHACAIDTPNPTEADGELGSEWDALRESGWWDRIGVRTDYSFAEGLV